jgi:uncharacterized protein
MVIDTHIHIFPPTMQHRRADFLAKDRGFRNLYQRAGATMVGVETVIAMMDREGVDKAVVFGFPWEEVDLCRQGNDYVLESAQKFPDRLIGFITVPWTEHESALIECERGLAGGARGVGELALYTEGLSGQTLSRLNPLVAMLEGKHEQIPLLLHLNEPAGREYPGKVRVEFTGLQQFIASHPRLPIILAHWGGGFFFYELIPEIRKICGNVFYDIAASPFLYRYQVYEVAAAILEGQRILFGSDYPLLLPRRYLQEMESALLTEEVRTRIKSENARMLLGG